jgi:hypothetical protein
MTVSKLSVNGTQVSSMLWLQSDPSWKAPAKSVSAEGDFRPTDPARAHPQLHNGDGDSMWHLQQTAGEDLVGDLLAVVLHV